MRRFFNTIFISLGTFLLVFCWFYYYTSLANISAIVGMITAILVAILTYLLLSRKSKKSLSIENARKIDRLKTYLALNDGRTLIAQLYTNNGYTVTKCDDCLDYTVTKRDDCLLAKKNDSTFLIIVYFSLATLTDVKMAEFIKISRQHPCDSLIVFCNQCDASTHTLAKSTDTNYRIVDVRKVYDILTRNDLCPNVEGQKRYKKASALISLALTKSRFGYYMTSAIFLTLFSLFSFLPYYNLAIATLLFVLALYSKFNKRFNSADMADELQL